MNLASLFIVLMITAPPEPRFSICANNNAISISSISSIKADGELILGDGKSLPAAEWFSFQRDGSPRPDWPSEAQAILANGDHIAGSFLRGDGQSATLKTACCEIKIPFSMLDVLWLANPPAATPAFADRYTWLKGGRKRDAVLLANDEVLSGDIDGFNDQNELRLKIDDKPRTLPAKVVQAIAFNPSLTVRKAAVGRRFQIVLASGSRITAKQIIADAKQVEITASFGAKLAIPWSDIVAITNWSNDVVPLSSLQPSRVEEVPFGSVTWPWTANRTVKHNPLRIKTANGIETFESGLGTHPKSTLSFDLTGKYRTFVATVSLDAITGRRGVVVLKVLVDGKVQELPKLNPLASIDGPQEIHVDVTKAKLLTLITDFGPAGDVQADVNWIDARLMK